ncbi:EAL domain-containing protein [Aromatoleum anaerobium]|nr:EAL domain-containing protein [Aromatoleum anaerobium]MCK0506051.1 EAL domain-containing protein [Aromatoleum anaerobium]
MSHPENNPQVKAAWEKLLSGQFRGTTRALRPAIDDSWRRCLIGQVDPGGGGARPAVERGELEALRNRNERLISASAPFMIQAREFLAHTGTVMILTDPEGTILDVEGDAHLRDPIQRAGLVPGHNWHESSMGTNAIGTALALGQPIQVHASEHFCEEVQRWTCAAAVIRDPVDASILGVLDLSGLRHDYSQHSLPLIATTANSIEARLAQMELERRFQLLEAAVQRLSAADGVIVFDTRGRLVKVNERAAPALAAWGVTLSTDTRIPVGSGLSGVASPQLPDWVLASRIEPVFRGVGLLGFVVSIPLPAVLPQTPDNVPAETAPVPARESGGRQAMLATMIDQTASLVSLKDLDGRYEFVNRRFEEVFGMKSADIVGRTDAQLFEREQARQMRARDLEAVERTVHSESTDEIDLGHRRVRLAAVRFPIFDEAGRVTALCTQATELGRPGLQGPAPSAADAMERADEGVMITDARGVILTVNAAFTRITGYSLQDVAGKLPSILQSGLHSQEFYESLWLSLAEHGRWQGEIQNRRKSGEIFPEWLTIYAVKSADGEVQSYVGIFGDSSALQTSQRRIEFMTTHDGLTGLPNRNLLMDRLSDCIADARRRRDSLAVMLIDLDHFKGINDSLGHDVGDLLLQQVAERLRRCLCDAHTLARVGGDEFAVIVRSRTVDEIRRLAAHTLEYLSVSFCIRGHELCGAASIGISLFPEDGDTATSLLQNADTALYEAKAQGRNRFRFFAAAMQAMVQQRMTLETGLRTAIDNDRFEIVYQPQNALAGGELVGAEALLRWRDPVLGEIPPGRFIPAAEEAGLIVTLSEHVLTKVLSRIALWRRQGFVPPRISINIVAQQLREPHFVEHLCELLESRGVPPAAICLELTEGTLMEDLDGASQMLSRLTERGIAVSIDDFGTGYSSLAYLGRLPIHELKVDQSFVRGIASEASKRSIIAAIIDMAHALGMQVLAEGIETEDQLAFLKERHCEMGQGYLFHRPLSAEAFERLFVPCGGLPPCAAAPAARVVS